MDTFRRAWRRFPLELRLCAEAAIVVWVVRLGLWGMSFRTLQRRLQMEPRDPSHREASAGQIAGAVCAVSRYVPRTSCLVQALAAKTLLALYGYDSRVRIGLIKDEDRVLQAHAWVECEGTIVIGGPNVEHFTPLSEHETSFRDQVWR